MFKTMLKMKDYDENSKLGIFLNRISILSYFIIIIFGLLGYLFIYMDITFLLTALIVGFGFITGIRESVKSSFIMFSIVIIMNILRIILTFPDYRPPGGSFLPYYEITNYLLSVIILTYVGIIMIILYYLDKEKFTIFNLVSTFGQLIFLKSLAMFLLLYLLPSGNGPEKIVNQIHMYEMIVIVISGTGIIFLTIARKVNIFIFAGIILGVGIFGLNLWFLILILPGYRNLIPPTEGHDFSNLLSYSIYCSFLSIFWILIMILLLVYNVVVNRNELIKSNKFEQPIIE